MVAVEFVAIHPLEYNALAVDLHQTVPHAELTEANTHAHDLLQETVRIIDTENGMVEIRLLRTPQVNPRDIRRKLVRRPHKMLIDLQHLGAVRIVEIEHNALFPRIAER